MTEKLDNSVKTSVIAVNFSFLSGMVSSSFLLSKISGHLIPGTYKSQAVRGQYLKTKVDNKMVISPFAQVCALQTLVKIYNTPCFQNLNVLLGFIFNL